MRVRRRWLFAVTTGLLLGAAATFLLARGSVLPPSYAVATLWEAPWGRGGVSVVTGADGRRYGPLAFAVGRGEVVLADSFARRLLLIPIRGGPPRVADFGPNGPLVEDVALAPGGTVYLAARDGAIWRWRPGMPDPRPVARLGERRAGLAWVEGLSVLPSGEPVVDLLTVTRRRAERSVFVIGRRGARRSVVGLTLDEATPPNAGAPPPAVVPAGGHALAVGARGGIYLLGFTRGGGRAVYRYDASGRLVGAVPGPGGDGHWSLLGVDRAGRIYLGLDLGTPQGRLQVRSGRGAVELSRPLPMDGLVQMGTYVRVGPAGGIYVARPTPRGLTLRRWRRLSRRFGLRLP